MNRAGLTIMGGLVVLFLAADPVRAQDPGDLVLPRAEGSIPPEMTAESIFPHWIHRINYRCDACHDRLFKMKLGATEITMTEMREGGSCATCHNGEAAFSIELQSCNRCHRAPATGASD